MTIYCGHDEVLEKGGLNPRNCYECDKHSYCSFRRDIDNAIRAHIGWVNVDMPGTPDWQRIFERVAKACLNFKQIKPDPRSI